MKGHKKEHKAAGGKAGYSEAEGTAAERKEVADGKDGFKKGGKVAKKKHGGKVEGKKPAKRADKFARGGHIKGKEKHHEHPKAEHHARGGKVKGMMSAGGMSAGSPMSGAGKTAEPKVPKNDESDD